MRRPRHEIEAEVPIRGIEEEDAEPTPDSQPQSEPRAPRIRRQIERICEAVDVNYDDLSEMIVRPGQMILTSYLRDENGELYRNEFNKLAMTQKIIPVDTTTFVGDERDF